MNDIPGINLVPEQWREKILFAAFVLMIGGRAYHAITSGGGLSGIWKALVFGTNAPKNNNQNQP